MTKAIHLFWQIPALTLSLFMCFVIGGLLSGLSSSAASEASPEAMEAAAQTAGLLLLACLMTAVVIAFPIRYARWGGLKLTLAIFLLYFGISTFMTQIESIFFNGALQIPSNMVWQIILSGLLTAILFSPLAVWIMGKMRNPSLAATAIPINRLVKPGLVIAVLYLIIYLLFGYFLAWQSPAVRTFYTGSTDILPFGEHMLDLLKHNPTLLLFQLFRGILWGALAWLVMRMTNGNWLLKAVFIGLLFGIMATGGLLLPNPFMPAEVRWAHFWETSTSNCLFGISCGYVLRPLDS
ncbi:MAG: hypothetical protein R2828_06760 [Saprospiraceae bacterium]